MTTRKNYLKTLVPQCINWSYEEKIKHTKWLIQGLDIEKTVVACSFGKCSMVVLHLVLQQYPNIPVSFQNTGVQHLLTYKFRDRIVKEWNLNFHQTYPIKNFWRVVREHGWSDNKEANNSCCWYLKKKPFKDQLKKYGWNTTIDGIRAEESRNRTFIIKRYGVKFYAKSLKLTRIRPIGFFMKEDIERYIQENNIPVCEIYDLPDVERSGCITCTAHKYWERQLKGLNRKMYDRVIRKRGTKEEVLLIDTKTSIIKKRMRQSSLKDFFESENKPCITDI